MQPITTTGVKTISGSRARNLLLCFLIGVIVHIVTIPVPLGPQIIFGQYTNPNMTYVYDDVVAIQRNPYIYDSKTSWKKLFTERDFWGNVLAWASSHKSYRPITSLTYRLQVLWDGNGINSISVKRSLHAFNVMTFGVVCAMFYYTCNRLEYAVRGEKTQRRGNESTKSDQFSLIAGLLFAVHPIHTEAVACLVGRGEILSGMFFLLSILAYDRYKIATVTCTSIVWYSIASLFAFASMLCKEQGVTVLAVWVLYDVMVATASFRIDDHAGGGGGGGGSSSSLAHFIRWVKKVLRTLLPTHMATLAVLYLLLKHRE
jgi:hypothetical protein